MLGRITRALAPPVFESEEKTRTASLVNTISLAVILIQAIVIVVPLYSGSTLRRQMLAVSALAISLVVQWLIRTGAVKAGSWTLVACGWLIVTLAAFTAGGLRAPANYLYVIPIICAGLLLGFRVSVLFVAATIAADCVMLVLSEKGLLAPGLIPLKNSVFLSNEIMFFVLIAALLHMATSSMRESLRRARLEIVERVRAQEALSRSETLLSNIVNNSSAAIFAKLPDGRYLMVNKHLEDIVGLPSEQIIGKTDYDIFPVETADAFRRSDRDAIRSAGTVESEVVIQRPDGPHTYMSIKFPLLDPSGSIYASCGIAADISDRKLAEAAIRSSEERFARAFNSSPVPMCIARDRRFVDVNDTFLQVTGYSRHEVIGRSGDDLNLYEDPQAGFKFIQLASKQGSIRNLEMNLRMRDGRIRTHLVSVEEIELGGAPSVLMVGIDISERKLAEDTLRNTEAKFREFFEDSLTGDYISTPDGKLLACNPAFARIFGFDSVEEAMTQDMRSLYPDSGDRERLIALLGKQGRVERHESELRRRDGTPLFVVENAIGSFDEGGELVQIKGYAFDITERRKLEQQLLQTQKIEAVGRLAGGIAHDFNNLLSVILAHSDLLERRTKDQPESARKDLDLIKQAGNRAAGLTRQLLAFSRQQVLDVRVIDLNSVVTSSLQVLGSLVGENVEFLTELEPEPVTVKADASQLEQVIMNLVVNARDAMPGGGVLHLRTAKVNVDEGLARLLIGAEPGPYAMLEVTDNGTGMDEQTKARMFEPFFTTKEKGKGTGLGLATVHGIVKQTGGHISVESTRDVGTTFRIFFPSTETRGLSSNSTGSRISAPSAPQTEPAATQSTTPRSADHLGEKKSLRQPGGEHLGGFSRGRDRNDLHTMLADVLMSRDYGDTQEHAEGPRSFKL